MTRVGPEVTALEVLLAYPPLLVTAVVLCGGLCWLNWVRHTERSLLSVVVIGLGFGFAGFIGLTIGATYFVSLLRVPYLDSILFWLLFLFVCVQSWLTVLWVSSPPERRRR